MKILINFCHKIKTDLHGDEKNNKNNKKNNNKKTRKFHGEFMSPTLLLFEVLKMGKLTRGPLVLYHLPKY